MKMADKKIKSLIENNPLALATIQNKKPYVIAVSCCRVVKNQIVITDNFMNRTVKNIKRNHNVALVGWDKKLNGYQFLGKARYFTTGKWLKFVKSLKENKNMPAKGAIVVKVREIIKSK